MKKIFALVTIVLAVILSSFTANAEVKSASKEAADDSTLTLEVIEELSWKELVDKAQYVSSEEDQYIKWLVINIGKRNMIPEYHNTEYIKCSVSGISTDGIESRRLTRKCEEVINLYNSSHSLELILDISYKNSRLNIKIKSKNLKYLEHPVTQVGQSAKIELGALYWQSSQSFGSGKYGIVSKENRNIPDNYIVTVDGVAYLDDNGNILSAEFGNNSKIELFNKRMLHISADGSDLGWVYPTHLMSCK